MSLAAVAAYGKGMDQKSINELCTVFHALSHGVGRELSSLQEYSVLASPPSPCSRPLIQYEYIYIISSRGFDLCGCCMLAVRF